MLFAGGDLAEEWYPRRLSAPQHTAAEHYNLQQQYMMPPPPPPPVYMHHGAQQLQQMQQHMAAAATPSTSLAAMRQHAYMTDNAASVASNNCRDARKRAEKQRRDKLNAHINDVGAMLPLVVQSPRKVDKTGVLRHAAHYIRTEHVFGNSSSKARQTMSAAAVRAFVEAESGILLTVTCRGLIVAAENVEQLLGHCKNDLLGQSLLTITHADDRDFLRQQLQPPNLPQLPGYRAPQGIKQLTAGIEEVETNNHPTTKTQIPSEDGDEDLLDRRLMEEKRSFHIRLARAGARSEAVTYEMMHIVGSFRRADKAPRPSCWTAQQVNKHKQRQRDNEEPCSYANDLVFIGMARPTIRPPAGERLLESLKPEYRTRHLIDGRIVQCDQRISLVAGYLTKEVAGLSPFTFMHKEDVRWVMIALRQMYDLSKPIGESCYRLVTRSGEFIYLKTTGFLEIDSKTRAVQSFVCINTLVDEKEGRALVREMKEKYSVKMMLPAPPEPPTTTPELEDPHQLEEAIMHLVSPLPVEPRRTPSPTVSQGGGEVPHSPRASLLEIKPPDLGSIKCSISKSVEVISSVHLASPKPSPDGDRARPSVLRNVSQDESTHSNGNIKQEVLSPLSTISYNLPNSCEPIMEEYSEDNFGATFDALGNLLPIDDDALNDSNCASVVNRTFKKQNGDLKRTHSSDMLCGIPKRRSVSTHDSQNSDVELDLDCYSSQYMEQGITCDDMVCLDEGIIISEDGQKFNKDSPTKVPPFATFPSSDHHIGQHLSQLQEPENPLPSDEMQQLNQIMEKRCMRSIQSDQSLFIQHESMKNIHDPHSPHHQTRV